MIVKRNLRPTVVLREIRWPLVAAAGSAVAAVVLRRTWPGARAQLPFAPIAMLGAAVAIFVAFRNNASYARWWEARTSWGTIHSTARVLARQIVASTDNALASGSGGEPSEVVRYRAEQVRRVIAFAHATRLTLREQDDWSDVLRFLPEEEHEQLRTAHHKPNMVLQRLGVRIKDGVRAQIVGQFDPITLEPGIASLNTALANTERIKSTPTPRQYDYFTRLAVLVLAVLVPFGLTGLMPRSQDALILPVAVVVGGVFMILERVGAIVDAPFANTTTDVPMTAICRDIERDLLEQLGEVDLPPAAAPHDGYLW